jgi:signal transduction histidine kinase
MSLSPEKTARITFGSALVLLLCGSLVATFVIRGLLSVEGWIHHAYTVELALGELDTSLAKAGRNRMFYIGSGSEKAVQDFNAAVTEVHKRLDDVRVLISDNPGQQSLCEHLSTIADQRIGVLRQSVALRQSGVSDLAAQSAFTEQVARNALDGASVVEEMKENEDQLVTQRTHVSQNLFVAILVILFVLLASSAYLFWIHYRLLDRELRERRKAQVAAQNVSAHLVRLQDDERRRLSRELHDGLGQNLVAAKMVAASIPSQDESVASLIDLLEQCVKETRTLSYLLHPPLLDEIGLASAARSLLDGFSKRTGLIVHADIPAYSERLPSATELVLFRVLQEALTNIHRHSKSASAEVAILQQQTRASLTVKDFGKGMPEATMERFRSNDTSLGIGLVGMRERVREQGGNLEIISDEHGTTITAIIPRAYGDHQPPSRQPELKTSEVVSFNT